MAKDNNEHLESDAEYNKRVQEEIDRGQWRGHVSVCDEFPSRAIVHEITPLDADTPPHIYRIKDR